MEIVIFTGGLLSKKDLIIQNNGRHAVYLSTTKAPASHEKIRIRPGTTLELATRNTLFANGSKEDLEKLGVIEV